MRIDKYIICGGEDLGVLIKSNQSPEALVTFKKWRPFLSKSCNETGKDCLFFTPLPNGSYFFEAIISLDPYSTHSKATGMN